VWYCGCGADGATLEALRYARRSLTDGEAMNRKRVNKGPLWLIAVLALIAIAPTFAFGQATSVSAWDAAHFRVWGYIPYWATNTQITNFATNGIYSHVSDVLYFGGLRPDANGNLTWAASSYQTQFNLIRSQSAALGFRMELSMSEGLNTSTAAQTDAIWESVIQDPTKRSTFITQLKNVMLGGAGTADDVKGFNFDWERPSTGTEWGNYNKLATELRAAFKDPTTPTTNNWEISVCDFGFADTQWDNTSDFNPAAYDQLFIMGYLYTASQNQSYITGHLALTQGGKAFTGSQMAIGVGTYTQGASTLGISSIAAANPSLAYNAGSYTGTIGSTTGTWTFESRQQVRDKTQVTLNAGGAGMFSWTLHYDATNNLGLDRVMHHYIMVKRDIPDLDLNGKVDQADATTLANNMGMSLTNTGTATAAQFDAFYMNGNWEKGDHDGNGFVNQADADWLAGRYAALGITLPDRLPYSGTFENFTNSLGLTGRWRAGRNAQNKLLETSNFKQEVSNFLTWSGQGRGATSASNSFVTIRNQNSAELGGGQNSLARTMQADITTAIGLGQNQDTYVKFLVRENTAPLTAAQLVSGNRILTLDFLSSTGVSQFDIGFRGLTHQFGIDSVADATGQDVLGSGFGSDTTYMLIAKISGNSSSANTMYASLFAAGATIGNFTDPSFQWMLTAQGSASFNPTITDIQFTSYAGANFTVSNVQIGDAATMLPPTLSSQGDFNHDGIVNTADYILWRKSMGQTGVNLPADGNGNNQVDSGDLFTWRTHFGQSVSAGAGSSLDSSSAVPEPTGFAIAMLGLIICVAIRVR
jgi:hypothetical protein